MLINILNLTSFASILSYICMCGSRKLLNTDPIRIRIHNTAFLPSIRMRLKHFFYGSDSGSRANLKFACGTYLSFGEIKIGFTKYFLILSIGTGTYLLRYLIIFNIGQGGSNCSSWAEGNSGHPSRTQPGKDGHWLNSIDNF